MMIRQHLRDNRIFLFSWGLILTFGLIWMSIRGKGEAVLFLNQFYTPNRNELFLLLTRLGESMGFLIVLGMLLIFKRFRHVVAFLAVALLVISIPFVLKHYVFPDAERPISFLGDNGLNVVENLRINTDHSFPSGHTTAGFAFFSYLAFVFRNNIISFFALVLATLVAVSRVYLVQHFVQDVVAGSVLGVLIAILCVWLIAEADWSKSSRFFLNIGLFK